MDKQKMICRKVELEKHHHQQKILQRNLMKGKDLE